MTKGYQNIPPIQLYFSLHSVGTTSTERNSFHFPSFPFGKLSLFSFHCLWVASLHHLVSPKHTGTFGNFSATFLPYLCKASCNVPSSSLRMSSSKMNNMGFRHVPTCQSHELFGSHSVWQDRILYPQGKPTKASIQQRIHFLNFQKKLAGSLLLQYTVPMSHWRFEYWQD